MLNSSMRHEPWPISWGWGQQEHVRSLPSQPLLWTSW